MLEESDNQLQQAGKGAWTPQEHSDFVKAFRLYGKDWVYIHKLVPTRSANQIKSHAQKFVKQLQKSDSPADQALLSDLSAKIGKSKAETRTRVQDELLPQVANGIGNKEFREKYTILPS
jgi:SHAQKYF class myb-like DNA-binding protein